MSTTGIGVSSIAAVLLATGGATTTVGARPGAEGLAIRSTEAGAWAARNPNGLRARFDAEGVAIRLTESQLAGPLRLTLEELGRLGATRPVSAAAVVAGGRRIELRRDALVEWYLNDERGLEQGFTLLAPPGDEARDARPLELVLRLDGAVAGEVGRGGRDARFRLADGSVLAYTGLAAWDAEGRDLAATLAVDSEVVAGRVGQRVSIRVDDADAVYPLTVDPVIAVEEAVLVPDEVGASGRFGSSVSVSLGSTSWTVVGARDDDQEGTGAGAAYFLRRLSPDHWDQGHKVTASDAAALDRFGASVAIDGSRAVVGAYLDDDGGASSGSAYVFTYVAPDWVQAAKLTASDGALNDWFGLSVAMAGERILVGAPSGTGAGPGRAYVFFYDGTSWSEETQLTASDGAGGDQFGRTVALTDDTAIVGAIRDDDGGDASGSAYVFRRSGTAWSQEAKLVATTPDPAAFFGSAVAIDGDLAVVGAQNDDAVSAGAGAAYVFRRTGVVWSAERRLTASDATAGDAFGKAVAVSGDRALIGAYLDDDAGSATGAAYVFVYDGMTWIEEQKIVASGASAGDQIGYAVALAGTTAMIGADGDASAGPAAGAVHVLSRSGTTWTEVGEHTPATEDRFGFAAAVSGTTAVVGSFGEDGAGSESGAAYVFVQSGGVWGQQARLVPDDIAPGDRVGIGVAVEGDTAVVGAYWDDDRGVDSGSAYVFTRSGTTWSQRQKLVASDGATEERFGFDATLQGDTLVIGAPRAASTGAAYVFERSGTLWSEVQKLVASDADTFDLFGVSVALDGDTLLVGAGEDDDNGADAGAAYVFVHDGTSWVEQAKLLASDGAANDGFGDRVALDGDTAVCGAYSSAGAGTLNGAAYVYVRAGTLWTQHQRLVASDGAFADRFGASVAIEGDVILVGAYGTDDVGLESGSVYLFARVGPFWNEQARLIASDGAEGANFGTSVALDGYQAIVGAWLADALGLDTGAAYAFQLQGSPASYCDAYDGALAACPCANAGAPFSGCDNAQGTGGVGLAPTGYAPNGMGGGTVTLVAAGFPPASTPTTVAIRSPDKGLFLFGDGLLCLTPPVVRFGATFASGGVASIPYAHGAGAGTFHYQLWYRNTPATYCDSTAAFNTSNGLTIVWP